MNARMKIATYRVQVWLRQTWVLIGKELRQLTRDVPLFLFIVFIFTGNIFLAAGETATELRNAPVVVHDADHTEASRDLIYRFRPPEFRFAGEVTSPAEGFRRLENGDARLFLDIPEGFTRSLLRGDRAASTQLLVDTSKSTTGFLATSEAVMITSRFAQEWEGKRAARIGRMAALPGIENRPRIWYNPALNQAWASMIAELLTMTLVACILLPGAALIREKERGTIEQLLVSPVSPLQVLLSKTIAMMTVTLTGTAVSLVVIMKPLYGFPIHGSLLLYSALTVLFVFASAAFGLAAATSARTSGQVGMLVLLIAMPMAILSGLRDPLESMPGWLQTVTLFFPLRHYIDITYAVLMRGAGLEVVWGSTLWLAGLGAALFAVSIYRFRRMFR